MNIFRRILNVFKPVKAQPAPQPQMPQMLTATIPPGLFLWELNLKTLALQIRRDLHPYQHADIYAFVPHDDCMYEVALTRRNAIRKLTNRLKLINQNAAVKQ